MDQTGSRKKLAEAKKRVVISIALNLFLALGKGGVGVLFMKRVVPVQSPAGEPSHHFASAPWFLVETMTTEDREVKKREFIENRYREAEKKKGLLVGRWLLKLKPDVVVAEENGSVALELFTPLL